MSIKPRQPRGVPIGGQYASGARNGCTSSLEPPRPISERAGAFTADDGQTWLLGYTTGETWNGFETPLLDQESMVVLAEAMSAARERYYDPGDGPVLAQDAGGWTMREVPGEAPEPVATRTGPGGVRLYEPAGFTFTAYGPDFEEQDPADRARTCVSDYLACAAWTGQDEQAEWSQEARERATEDLRAFIADNAGVIMLARMRRPDFEDGQVAHDLWLTRNGHGAGFWDRDLGPAGDVLAERARELGECEAYLGEDGLLHLS